MPWGITHDDVNLYVCDRDNNTIRQIDISTKQTSIVAGSAGMSGSSNGIGPNARFYSPFGIVRVGDYLFVCDENNSTIRAIHIPTKEVTTLAGTVGVQGVSDGAGTSARFNTPYGIASDGANLYVCDMGCSTIRKIVIASRVVTTFAGSAAAQGSTDGNGTAALFLFPEAITCDGTNLYVTDTCNHTIRKIVMATRTVSTFAGTAGLTGLTDGIGNEARFKNPRGIIIDGTDLYVCDSTNSRIRKIAIPSGQVTTLTGGDGPGYQNGFVSVQKLYSPFGICMLDNILYFTQPHCIRRVN
jgi:sugar lactone lactonase YvrE